MKAGWKTSEFWAAIVAQLISVLILTGVLQPEEGDTIKDAVGTLISAGLSLASVFKYIHARTAIKAQAMVLAAGK